MKLRSVVLIAVALGAWVGGGMRSDAGPSAVAAGYDLFETVARGTTFDFSQNPIPAGFFAPGSEPFGGTIRFAGRPLESFTGHDTGSADTIVRRGAANLTGPGSSDTVPIELVGLSLVSTQPITVTAGGGNQAWEVYVAPSPGSPSRGSMTIHQIDANGGTFDSVLPVKPVFTFVRHPDGKTKTLDLGLPAFRSLWKLMRLRARDVPWTRTCPPGALVVPGLNAGFCASATRTKPVATDERSRMAKHRIRPARFTEIDRFAKSAASITLNTPSGSETVELDGPTTVRVMIGPRGQARDTDGDGKDQVQTEIIGMELTGMSSVGQVQVRLRDARKHPFRRSTGEIEETRNVRRGYLDLPPFADAGSATSFFDVYFEIKVAGKLLHNDRPKRMRARITAKPPRVAEFYFSPAVIPLLDARDRPTPFSIGSARHTPYPPEFDVFPDSIARVTIEGPAGAETVELEGLTRVTVMVGPNGEATDTDGDGKDQARTEITSMTLTGTSSMGMVEMRVRDSSKHPKRRSTGEIEEQTNTSDGCLDVDPFTPGGVGTSFFDVFVEVEVNGMVLHSHKPKRMRATIRHKPPGPGEFYFNPAVIPLFTEGEHPSGFSVTGAYHTPNPPEIDEFDRVQAQILLDTPGGQRNIALAGTVRIAASTDDAGVARDTDGDGLDQVDTELLGLNLVGDTLSSRVEVTVRTLARDPKKRSAGEIEERRDRITGRLDIDPFAGGGMADSFFDVFFEITVDGKTLHNRQPLRIAGTVRSKPAGPGDQLHGVGLAALRDEDGRIVAGYRVLGFWLVPVGTGAMP